MALAATLPETSESMLADVYLSDHEAASARIFRVYKAVKPHYHETCHEHLYVLSGRGKLWIGDESAKAEIGPGEMVVFEKNVVHAIPEILEEPLVFLAIDAPRRAPPISSSSIRRTARRQASWPATPSARRTKARRRRRRRASPAARCDPHRR